MERTRTVLATPRNDGATLFRARITKLSEVEASNGCATLKEKDISCFVVADADTQSTQ